MSFTCTDCNTSIPGTDCAYQLARSKGWKNKPGCYAHCRCGYPVRAKEVRVNIFSGVFDSDKKKYGYIYVETNSGQGHVYYGNWDTCLVGNGLCATGMSNAKVYRRYTSTK